ncbi:MAG: ATP-binding response regulator, partial [Telluria sp.]
MTAQADGGGEAGAVRRRMLAFAALEGHPALPAEPARLGELVLAALHEDVESLAAYSITADGGDSLLLYAGCRHAPPAHAADAAGIGAAELSALAVHGGAVHVFEPGPPRPAWIGERAPALAVAPFGGREPDKGRGLALFALRSADRSASLAALLELGAQKIWQVLMREPAPAAGEDGGAARQTRVLLIDDEPLLVAHVKRILERAGFAFHAAQSARGGFELASSVQPDVILIDQVMPDLDGTRLLRMMREDALLSTVPVIMLSGYADEAARIAALGEGADDFVAKPFSAKDLVARIEANVRLVRLRRDAVWREGELLRLRQSQQELRKLLDTVQRVRDDERRMLSREVHDQLGQILTVARIDIRLLQDRIAKPGPPPSLQEIAVELDAALSGVDLATSAVQNIAALLRPPKLEEGGLVAALRWQAADLQRRAGIDCIVLHDPEAYVEQPPFVAGELLRMCQEALTNVLRHAGASQVIIQVTMRNACLLVRICDNGSGI